MINQSMTVIIRHHVYIILACSLMILVGCADGTQTLTGETMSNNPAVLPKADDELELVTGQTLYVPAYSQIFTENNLTTLDLAIMLSIRNTDFDEPIVIRSIEYYDTEGNLVKEFIETPVALSPMATTEVVIGRTDKRGGTGANFIVRWGASAAVHEPIVEAVMTNTANQQGVTFVSPARVLEQTP